MTHTSDMYSGTKAPINIEVKTEHNPDDPESELQQQDTFDV